MIEPACAILYGLLLWWSSTALIIYLDALPRSSFRWSMAGATVVLAASLYGLAQTRGASTPAGAYAAFSCAVLAWGWTEMAFLMGFITGPRRSACLTGCRGPRHFVHAVQAILYHELSIAALAGAVWALTLSGSNRVGAWTFLVLWVMRVSAKMNLFLGVRNLQVELLPEHLRYLAGFFGRRPLNAVFPVSVTVSTVAAAFVWQQAASAAAGSYEASAYALVATLLTLAIIEHWMLVAPFSTEGLWRGGLHSRRRGENDIDITLRRDHAKTPG